MSQTATALSTESSEPISNPVDAEKDSSADLEPYMCFVHQTAARMKRRLPPNVLRDDLVAAGTYGLMDALRKHKGERGRAFEWYARVRIRGAMLDELRTQDWLSRRRRRENNDRVGAVGVPTAIVGLEDLPPEMRSPPSNDATPCELAESQSQRTALSKAVTQLPAREASIIEMHYVHGIPFKEIAISMRVSESRVSQLHTRATSMLREILVAAGEDPSC